MALNIQIRSYHGEHSHHRHDFAQVVLPICGRMEIDVGGRGGYIDQSQGAFVSPGVAHDQLTRPSSRFLVIDCPVALAEPIGAERLGERVYVPISPATRRLIEYAELAGNDQLLTSSRYLVPLLLGSLAADPFAQTSGMGRLVDRLRMHSGAHWSNEKMAETGGMSLSELHRAFRTFFGTTPQAWLAKVRIDDAKRWLRSSSLPIVDIALRTGFSDQAALTRAMQRLEGVTPGAYRKHPQSG